MTDIPTSIPNSDNQRLIKANEYLNVQGLRNLSSEEAQQVSIAYRNELLNGLNKTQPSSLKMFPSFLNPVDLVKVPMGATALVTEVGGTNGYGAIIKHQDGHLKLHSEITWALGKRIYQDAEEFFESITTPLGPILESQHPDVLALVYSFPGDTRKTERGVDAISLEDLPKGFVIPGISHKPVGESYEQALALSYPHISANIPLAVMNDTVAVLFSTSNAGIGGVIGTGFNLAVNTPSGIINTESGAFDKLPSTNFDEKVNAADQPGIHLAEKRIAGKHMGLGLGIAVEGLVREGLLPHNFNVPYQAETVSDLLLDDVPSFYRNIDSDSLTILKSVAQRLRDRSVQLTSIMVGTAVNTFPEQFSGSSIIMPIEGSVFWNVPQYKEMFTELVAKRTGREIILVSGTGRLGAAGAAFSLL